MYDWTQTNLYGARDAHVCKIPVEANGQSTLTLFAYYQINTRSYLFQINYTHGRGGTMTLLTGKDKNIEKTKDKVMIAAIRLKKVLEENA